MELKELTALPPEIGQLQNLRKLSIDYSEIELPAEIGHLKNLEEIHLLHTRLPALPAETGNLQNLKVLSLPGNELKSVPVEIQQLKNLELLVLSHSLLSEPEQQKIKKLLPNTTIHF